MTPVALGARSSASPVPAGSPMKHAMDSGGTIGFPSGGNPPYWMNSSAGISQLGPFNRPGRFWLVAGANWITYPSSIDWNRFDVALYLLQGGVGYVADLNGQVFHQNADSLPGNYYADWCGQSIEAAFYCEAGIDWYVRFLSMGNGSGNNYYQHPIHQNFWAHTVGEGVY